MSDTAQPATVRDWTDVLRRVRFGATVRVPGASRGVRGATVRAVALMLATFADSDGSRAFPGTARLSVACELDYRTTKRCVAILRHFGLITAVRVARRARRADEYQLTLPVDLLERLEVMTPAAVEAAIAKIRRDNRSDRPDPDPYRGAGGTPVPDDSRVPEAPQEDAPGVPEAPVEQATPDRSRGASRTHDDRSRGASRTVLGVRVCPPTHHDLATTPTYHSERDLRTELKVVGTAASEDQISPSEKDEPDPPPLPEKCPHGLSSRLRPDGSPSCALCRVGAPPAEHTTNVVPLPRRVA